MCTYLYPDAGAGEGARLVRGATHKQSNFDAASEKKERQMQTKRQGEEAAKMEFEDDCTEACVKRCTHCPRIFARPQAHAQHVVECVQGKTSAEGLSKDHSCTAKYGRSCAGCCAFSCQSRYWA